ncbi:hypothetical protein TgHK011_002412 [Trichoderma gracile]|nr:hypothetical protein TgHK011_002412 [Trichoderma gracile]
MLEPRWHRAGTWIARRWYRFGTGPAIGTVQAPFQVLEPYRDRPIRRHGSGTFGTVQAPYRHHNMTAPASTTEDTYMYLGVSKIRPPLKYRNHIDDVQFGNQKAISGPLDHPVQPSASS